MFAPAISLNLYNPGWLTIRDLNLILVPSPFLEYMDPWSSGLLGDVLISPLFSAVPFYIRAAAFLGVPT